MVEGRGGVRGVGLQPGTGRGAQGILVLLLYCGEGGEVARGRVVEGDVVGVVLYIE